MLRPDLIGILACPETKQPVKLADAGLIEKLNEQIAQGKISNRGGRRVDKPISAALIREDGKYLYPVVDDIPVMLIDEGIPVEELAVL